jgi:hypothetical protein
MSLQRSDLDLQRTTIPMNNKVTHPKDIVNNYLSSMAASRPQLATLPVLCTEIDAMLNTLCQQLVSPRSSLGSSLIDVAERFSIWADNIGAKQDLSSQMSLQYRVREAPKLASLFLGRLEDLREDLADREFLPNFGCVRLQGYHSANTDNSSHGCLE